jgi:hypothetical protein
MLRLSLGVPDDLAASAASRQQSNPQRDSSLLSSGDFKNIIDIYARCVSSPPLLLLLLLLLTHIQSRCPPP